MEADDTRPAGDTMPKHQTETREYDISTNVVDRRKTKTYYREVTVGFEYDGSMHEREVSNAARQYLAALSEESFAPPIDQTTVEGIDYVQRAKKVHHSTGWYDSTHRRFSVNLHATKPSLVCSEEDAVAFAREYLVPAIEHGVAQDSVRAERVAHEAKVIEDAQMLMRWVRLQSHPRAKDVVRYEQRMAALRAELQAEALVQVRKTLGDELDEAVAKFEAEHGELEPEALAWVKKHAPTAQWGAVPISMFPSQVEVRREHIYPEKEKS